MAKKCKQREDDFDDYLDAKRLFEAIRPEYILKIYGIGTIEETWFEMNFPWENDYVIQLRVFMPLALFEAKNNCLTDHMRESLVDIIDEFELGTFDDLLIPIDLAELTSDIELCKSLLEKQTYSAQISEGVIYTKGNKKLNIYHPDFLFMSIEIDELIDEGEKERKEVESQYNVATNDGLREYSKAIIPLEEKYDKRLNEIMEKYKYLYE